MRGQHVDSPAGAQHGLRHGGVRRRVGVRGEVSELLVVRGASVAAGKGPLGRRIELERLDEPLPHGVARRRRLGGGNAAGDLADLRNRGDLAKRGGAVPGIAVDVEPALPGALLADVEGERVAAGHRQVAAAGLGQAVLPRKSLGLVLIQPPRAQPAAGLLIGHAHEGELAARVAAPGDLAGHRGLGGGDKQHVYRPAAVEFAVLDDRLEGRLGPLVLVDRDDVGVAQKRERFGVRVAGRHGKRDGHPPRVRLEALDFHRVFHVGEKPLERVRVAVLLAGIGGEVVHARVADEFAEEGQGVIVKRHAASVSDAASGRTVFLRELLNTVQVGGLPFCP